MAAVRKPCNRLLLRAHFCPVRLRTAVKIEQMEDALITKDNLNDPNLWGNFGKKK
jgi:hypothetical protein